MATSLEVVEAGGDFNYTVEVQSSMSPGGLTKKRHRSSNLNSNSHAFLTRCTSTPLNRGGFLTTNQDFVTPGILTRERHRSSNFKSPDDIPNFGFDSGFESDLSRSTPGIITRSRSRQWSGPASTSTSFSSTSLASSVTSSSSTTVSSGASSSTISLISHDLRKFTVKDQSTRKRTFTHFRPGVLDKAVEKTDIIRRLNDKGTMHILTIIWQSLNPEELGKAMQVSQTWNIAILSDRDAIDRYIAAKELAMDQNSQSNKHVCSRLLKKSSGPRKALGTLNLIESPVKPREQQRRSPRLANSPNGNSKRRSPNELAPQIVSPSKFRHKLFTEEAPKLGPDEVLKPCPRCTGPSRIVPKENKGLCSRIGCQFHFCTLCNCLYHLRETPCRLVRGCKIKTIISPLNSPQKSGLNNSTLNSKAARVSSKQSKKRLKRL